MYTPAFIAILIEYFRRFLSYGLREAAAITAATLKFQTDNDIFAEFKDLYLEEDAGRVLNITEAQNAFRRWASMNGRRVPNKVKDFFDSNLGPSTDKPIWDTSLQKSVRGWEGWKLIKR